VLWVTHFNWDPLGVIDLFHGSFVGFSWVFRLFQSIYAGIMITAQCGDLFWRIMFSPSFLHTWTACNEINGIL